MSTEHTVTQEANSTSWELSSEDNSRQSPGFEEDERLLQNEEYIY